MRSPFALSVLAKEKAKEKAQEQKKEQAKLNTLLEGLDLANISDDVSNVVKLSSIKSVTIIGR